MSLRVASLSTSLKFYESILGLQATPPAAGSVTLTAAQSKDPLIELLEYPGAKAQPLPAAGLFHMALLLPSRIALGSTLRRLSEERWPLQGASDHVVSEALYLADPDGNGIEIYADRPRNMWPRNDGRIQMATLPLNIRSLLTESAGADKGWNGLPMETAMGHVHLRVPSIAEARALFVDVIGFDITSAEYPGAIFVSAGGYHHHVAANVWDGEGIGPLPPNAAGLLEFAIIVPDPVEIENIAGRAASRSVHSERLENGVILEHAGGIRVRLLSHSTRP